MLTKERAVSRMMGAPIKRNHPDSVTQRLDDLTKNVSQTKGIRSSMTVVQDVGRNNALGRQALAMGKEKVTLRDDIAGSALADEKLHRPPDVEEWCDKKMKRKRSAGSMFNRLMDSDGESKQNMHPKFVNKSGLQDCDDKNFRSSVREESHSIPHSPATKKKGLRSPRACPLMAGNSCPNLSRAPEILEGWEHSLNENPLENGVTNSKRRRTGSSAPPMKWVGKKRSKTSCMKRANLVSSVSNCNEAQIMSEGCYPTNLGRITSIGNNESLPTGNLSSDIPQLSTKHEKIPSPARLSESEESGAGKNCQSRFKEEGTGNEAEERASIQNMGPSGLPTKKSKVVAKEDPKTRVRRQGRSSKESSLWRAIILPKMENFVPIKPYRRPGSDRNGSKSGRPPLKKLTEGRAFSRLRHTSIDRFPDVTGIQQVLLAEINKEMIYFTCVVSGESDDDREELLKAARLASISRYLASSDVFWKEMEPIFGPVSLEDMSFLKQQLKSMEECHQTLSERRGCDNDDLGDHVHEENFLSHGRRESSLLDKTGSKESTSTFNLVDQVQDFDTLFGKSDSKERHEGIPLYQRLLSSMITEDEIEELEENNREIQYSGDKIDCEFESILGLQAVDRFLFNGSTLDKGSSTQNKTCKDDLSDKDHVHVSSGIGTVANLSTNGLHGLKPLHANASGNSSINCQYEQMSLDNKLLLELQSVGIYPDIMPDLEHVEDAPLGKDIVELEKTMCQRAGQRKEELNKILKAVEEDSKIQGRNLEQVAMDKDVEIAYRKLLGTRGNSGSRTGIPRVQKEVAASYMLRSLDRCKKFEDTGKSCFSEPPLRDVLFAAPLRNDVELITNSFGSEVTMSMQSKISKSKPGSTSKLDRASVNEISAPSHNSDHECDKTKPILNKGKKRELLVDDVRNASLKAALSVVNTLPRGAKGKRSKRKRCTSLKNSVAKSVRPSANSEPERKTKKSQLPTSENGGDAKKKGDIRRDPPKEAKESANITNVQQSKLDVIEGLDATNGLAGHQDLASWLDFKDDENSPEHYAIGLPVPMDDISDLNLPI